MDQPPFAFRARGPVEVTGDSGQLTPVEIPDARRTVGIPVGVVFALLVPTLLIAALWGLQIAGGAAAVAVAVLVIRAILGLETTFKADRSGLRVGSRLWTWDDVHSVDDDLVRWRLEDDEGRHNETFEHAVIIRRRGRTDALWVRNQALAEEITDKLRFFARQESGNPEDVPEKLRQVAKSPAERA